MDLALALGQPAELLARTMTEREFRRWAAYRKKNLLPHQMMNLYLAQIAQLIAITMGGQKQAKIADYLIELEPPAPVDEAPKVIDIEEVRRAFGYNPRVRKQQKES